jgi:hypothetical protein
MVISRPPKDLNAGRSKDAHIINSMFIPEINTREINHDTNADLIEK